MTLFFGCDKLYSYCIIASNSSISHILLSNWKNRLQLSQVFTVPQGYVSVLQHFAIFDCFSEKNYGNQTIDEEFICENLP